MSDTNQEPTMEEILASIRRIISEDDAPAEGEAVAEAAPAEAAPPEPESLPDLEIPAAEPPPLMIEDGEEVLELTDRLDDPMADLGDPLDDPEALSMSDLEVMAPSPKV